MKFKWRAIGRRHWYVLFRHYKTDWHEESLEQFIKRFNQIPYINGNRTNITWTFQFKDFEE